MTKQIIATPVATEKAYAALKNNEYVFSVPLDANRNEIKSYIEEFHKVSVVSIRTLIRNGKNKRIVVGTKRRQSSITKPDSKKAYVKLADGDKIKVFEEAETAATDDKKKADDKEAK